MVLTLVESISNALELGFNSSRCVGIFGEETVCDCLWVEGHVLSELAVAVREPRTTCAFARTRAASSLSACADVSYHADDETKCIRLEMSAMGGGREFVEPASIVVIDEKTRTHENYI